MIHERACHKHRILIVEDDASLARMFSLHLMQNGYACEHALCTESACRLMSEQAFDLMLCDIMMPGKSGIECVGDMMNSKPRVPTIMVTGNDEPMLAQKALDLGVHGLLMKPVSASQLLVSVENALFRARLEEEIRTHRHRLEERVEERTRDLQETLTRTADDLQRASKELERAHRKITEQKKSLIESERIKVLLQMAGATAHELNQPLTAILCLIELMELNKDDPDKMQGNLKNIMTAGERMAAIVKKIQIIRSDDLLPDPDGGTFIDTDKTGV